MITSFETRTKLLDCALHILQLRSFVSDRKCTGMCAPSAAITFSSLAQGMTCSSVANPQCQQLSEWVAWAGDSCQAQGSAVLAEYGCMWLICLPAQALLPLSCRQHGCSSGCKSCCWFFAERSQNARPSAAAAHYYLLASRFPVYSEAPFELA